MMATIRTITLCALASLTVGCASSRQLQPQHQPHPSPRAALAAWAPLTEPALLGSWKLTRVNSQPTLPRIGLKFEPGMVRGTLTCGNALFAFYTVVPTNIFFRQTTVTERGCDDAQPLHVAAEKTLRGPVSAYLAPNQQVLHIQGSAALELTRSIIVAEADAIRKIKEIVNVGDAETPAVRALAAAKFSCRPLTAEEYSRMSVEHVKEWTCSIETDQTETGYRLIYAGLAVDRQGKLLRVTTGSYPVVYRNLRIDHLGRTIVVQDR